MIKFELKKAVVESLCRGIFGEKYLWLGFTKIGKNEF